MARGSRLAGGSTREDPRGGALPGRTLVTRLCRRRQPHYPRLRFGLVCRRGLTPRLRFGLVCRRGLTPRLRFGLVCCRGLIPRLRFGLVCCSLACVWFG